MDIDNKHDENEALAESKSGITLYPKSKDVLMGRGSPYQEFSGNLIWSQAIYDHLDRYVETNSRCEKTGITMYVVRTVLNYNGRFLQRTSVGWKVLDELCAREKTAIAFRSRAKLAAAGAIPLSVRTCYPADVSPAKRPRLDPSIQ
jgi:hypothetical protein